MARDTHVLKDLEARLRDADFKFVRVTGKGHRRWSRGSGRDVVTVELPTKGYEHGRQKKNVEAEVKRALRACGKAARPKPKRVEREAPFEISPTPEIEAQEESTPRTTEEDAPRDEPAAVADGPDSVAARDSDLPSDVSDAGRARSDLGPPGHGEIGLQADEQRALTCEACGAEFERAIDLGRHKFQRHRIRGVSERAARDHRAKLVSENVSQAGKLVWREATKPQDSGASPSAKGAVLVAGTATMERVAFLAEALGAAARELVTEYKLVREENARLAQAVQQLDRTLGEIRGHGRR